MLLLLNQTNKESSAGVNITNMQKGGWDNANNPSTHNASNVETSASAITKSLEDGQTPDILMN